MSKSLVGKLIRVSWYDHSTCANVGWLSLDELEASTPSRMTSVGWVAVDNKKFIVIASTHSSEDHYQGDFCILKGTIKKIKVLND